MNVTIVAVDRLREAYVREGCALYVQRLAPYMTVNAIEIRKAGGEGGRALEGERLLSHVKDGDVAWALDREGEALTSEALVERLGSVERSGARRLVLIIGGAEGLDERVLARAAFRWSLSKLTFLHEMARLIALEQLYRAAKIARGEPYHR